MSVIYKILNTVNGKFYIGSTIDAKRRWKEHRSKLNKNKHINLHLQNSWNKYGESSFSFNIIKIVDNNAQYETEQKYLDKLKPFGKRGYNVCTSAMDSLKRMIITKICKVCGTSFPTVYTGKIYCSTFCSEIVSLKSGMRDNLKWMDRNYNLSNINNWDVEDHMAYEWDERMSK